MNKKETLEEAIKQELENHFFSNISEIKQAEYFINFGALWQQEQMFELMNHYTDDVMAGCNLRAEEWVKQIYKAKL
jgi:hypothetical protein